MLALFTEYESQLHIYKVINNKKIIIILIMWLETNVLP